MTIILTKRFIDGELPTQHIGLEGWYTLQAVKGDRVRQERMFRAESIDRQIGPFHNLITDLGMNSIGSDNTTNIWTRCHVGTGTTTPNVTDTALANFLASVNSSGVEATTNGFQGSPDYYTWRRWQWLSAVGALGNNNLTEVGIARNNQNTNGNLVSRELIRDGSGVPTAFPIASDEQLRVIYEIRLYVPQADRNDSGVMVGSTSYDTITRAVRLNISAWKIDLVGGRLFQAGANNNAYSGDLPAFGGGDPSGLLGASSAQSTAAYTNGNFFLDTSVTWAPANGNGNIRSILRDNLCCQFGVRYDPVIPKTNVFTLVLNQRYSWARHTP